MVWINGCPQFQVDLPFKAQDIIKIVDVPYTPLLIVLTPSGVFVFDKFTLLPLTHHTRNVTSMETNGSNLNIKIKHLNVNTSKLQKLSTVNLFIRTDLNFLIIYQVLINYSKSLYEVVNTNNELIQLGLPMTFTPMKFSISSFFKNATKTIIHGTEDAVVNLENIENVNNCSIDDEVNNFNIGNVKISIFKILKIGIGYEDYWVQSNSHNLFVFNTHDDKLEHEDKPDDFIQLINIADLKTKLYLFSEFEWYNSERVTYIQFNEYDDCFIFCNVKNEIWFMSLYSDEFSGYKIGEGTVSYVSFNPKYNLMIFNDSNKLKLATTRNKTLHFIKEFPFQGQVSWSSCGEFFILIDEEHHWRLVSKFGNVSFDTKEKLNELENNQNLSFLNATEIVISSNSSILYVLNENKLHYMTLVRSCGQLLYDKEYISLIGSNRNLLKLPILPRLKHILQFQDHLCGQSQYQQGKFRLSQNIFNQISISFGDNLAVSTPFATGGEVNHVLWFNFRNYLAESMNIINHFWFRDYLIVINRISTNDNEEFTDEFMVLDTSLLKYGMGGDEISFNSDLIIWKYNFNSTFIESNIINNTDDESKVVLLTNDHRLIVLDLSSNKVVENKNDSKYYKIYLSIDKTVHLSSMVNKINLNDVIQISMIKDKHFLFLSSNGDLHLLKNQSPRRTSIHKPNDTMKSSNIYDLMRLHTSIEYFRFKSIHFQTQLDFIYLFDGAKMLIYEIDELINKSKPTTEPMDDLLEDIKGGPLLPISVVCSDLQPIDFESVQNTSIDLVGIENIIMNKFNGPIIKNRVKHQLILNDFIEFDLLHKGDLESSFNKYKHFKNFHYCLELLLFKHLTIEDDHHLTLKRLFQLIEFTDNSESIYINCLRKIEIVYWSTFFKILNTTPDEFMNRLIEIENVELCYNYLIVYLNYKKEEEEQNKKDFNQLSKNDKKIILKIIKMLDHSNKYDWCFELCRFIKILEPTNQFLIEIKNELL